MRLKEARDLLEGMNAATPPNAGVLRAMKDSGLVGVYAPTPRRVWVFGAVVAELAIDASGYVSEDGFFESENDDEPGFFRALQDASHPVLGKVPVTFETNAPVETFSVVRGDNLFCVGILMDLRDL